MAKKAQKQLAVANTQSLKTLHLSSAALNGLFILYRILYHFRSVTKKTVVLYLLFSAPAFVIQFYFEKLSRPRYAPSGELQKTGEDLASKGLMEYMWDVLYITWACLVTVMLLGEKGWWLWAAIPTYAGYFAFTMMGKMRQGFGSGVPDEGIELDDMQSNRQKKLEKRGGQRVQYR